MKIFKEDLLKHLELAEQCIATVGEKNTSVIEYRSADEGLEDAEFFVIRKESVNSSLEAFFYLFAYQIHFHNEWDLADTNAENAKAILEHSTLPLLNEGKYQECSPTKALKEIDRIIQDFPRVWKESFQSPPDRWGLYVDQQEIPSHTTLAQLRLKPIISGCILHDAWNWVEIMYETPHAFILFNWSTGA